MDALSALDVARDILDITESTYDAPNIFPSAEEKDGATVPEKIRKFELEISKKHATLEQRLPTSPSPLMEDEQALLKLAYSCLEDSGVLLEAIGSILKRLPGNTSQLLETDTIAWVRSELAGGLSLEKIKQFSHAVTRYASSSLNSRTSELNKTIQSLEDVRRYTRLQHERLVNPDTENSGASAEVSVASTEADIRIFSARLASLIEAENLFADRIVASLNYASRPARHNSVPQAHKSTFQWAFYSRLAEWFRSGSGTFSVSGNPGHPRTKDLLTRWAGSADVLAMGVHLFWIAGTPIQKSWLQSLLFDVCQAHPSVVSLISPGRWAAAKTAHWRMTRSPALTSADDVPLKICFFIDGLDEYDSDHDKRCEVLCDMANSPHIKMCVSSRPWPVFERSFGGESKERLDIHELTRNDIRSFVSDQLRAYPKWEMHESGTAAPDKSRLREQIVDRSGGQLFKHMLESVDQVAKMAAILQATAYALEPLHTDLYWHLERELEERDYAHRCPIGSRPPEQISRQREQASRSISEKTNGLLKLADLRVEFLHRTVKDFVLTKDATCLDHGKGLNSGPFVSHLNQALIYASEASKADDGQTTILLDKYEAAVEAMVRAGHATVRGVNSEACHPRLPFREELPRHSLAPYIAEKIRAQPDDFFPIFDESPLFAALTPMSLSSGESPAPAPGVLDILLRRGEDLNAPPRVKFLPSLSEAAPRNLRHADVPRRRGPDAPLLVDRPGAHIIFSHFLKIATSRLLGEECFDGYMRTLDAFFRAGAGLGVPTTAASDGAAGPDVAEAAFGDLARSRPEESVLASYCGELRGLMARLAADPGQAQFLAAVAEKIIVNCSGSDEDLEMLSLAISEDFPQHVAGCLLGLTDSKQTIGTERKSWQGRD
ncbi:hypothetical protein F5Y14DRAFT_463963 [Nemania sp. NC0429]|nr:hypothetical protein F5Y14DRAFT_463963 [Nemania sp. NC0429]